MRINRSHLCVLTLAARGVGKGRAFQTRDVSVAASSRMAFPAFDTAQQHTVVRNGSTRTSAQGSSKDQSVCEAAYETVGDGEAKVVTPAMIESLELQNVMGENVILGHEIQKRRASLALTNEAPSLVIFLRHLA
mmetsp:Transcript_29415/g.61517  ORF Transcript_29415/g.61517 Transcript_29415/m.61517 type:complete len:134 (-) Transcript_29415:721-1122(-)